MLYLTDCLELLLCSLTFLLHVAEQLFKVLLLLCYQRFDLLRVWCHADLRSIKHICCDEIEVDEISISKISFRLLWFAQELLLIKLTNAHFSESLWVFRRNASEAIF